MLLVWACGRQFTDVSGVGLGALDVLVPNHHAVLGHRFEETAPRVLLLLSHPPFSRSPPNPASAFRVSLFRHAPHRTFRGPAGSSA